MPIPRRLKIVGKVYRIEPVARDTINGNDYGDCHPPECRIRVASDVDIQQIRDTLLHELLHALWSESALGSGEGLCEESVVRQLATSLLATLRDNPALVRFLTEKED